jgi:hypothetical protein
VHVEAVEAAVADGGTGQRVERALCRFGVHERGRTGPRDLDRAVTACGRGPRQLERVRRLQVGLPAAPLDPGGQAELVEQLAELHRGDGHHLEVAVGRRLDVREARERPRKAVHGRQGRAQVVARQRHELRERRVRGLHARC